MTDKEKIRAEIEKLRKSYQIKYQELDCTSPEIISVYAKRNLCQDILFLIDSLQEEPVSEDLEEAIGEYCSNPENFITYIDVGFRQSPIKKDDILLIIKAIKFGANWQKEQLMKNAIDTIVKVDAGGYPYVDRTIELYDYDREIPLAKKGYVRIKQNLLHG